MFHPSTQKAVVNQAIDYINQNLKELIRAEDIADHCCYSRHHFNRLFRKVTGETLYSFIKRQKLESAASLLFKYPDLSITDIAADFGYSSSNFSVAFQNQFRIRPSQCRSGDLPGTVMERKQFMIDRIEEHKRSGRLADIFEGIDRNVRIRRLPEIFLKYERYIGSYFQLPRVWEDYMSFVAPSSQRRKMRFYGLTYSDPLVTEMSRCIHDLCVEVPEPSGLQCHRIPAGEYICYAYRGDIRKLYEAYSGFMGIWLPDNSSRTWSRNCLEIYYPCSSSMEINMEVCVLKDPD